MSEDAQLDLCDRVLHVKDGKKFFDVELLRLMKHNGMFLSSILSPILEQVDVASVGADSSGMTLLHHAVNFDDIWTTVYLIHNRCKIDALDCNGDTPLMRATVLNHIAVGKILLCEKASVLARNRLGQTPLSMALDHLHKLSCPIWFLILMMSSLKTECLADSRVIANALISVKCPLTTAVYVEDAVVVRYILDEGYCTIDDCDPQHGFTALHSAVKCGDLDTLRLLLECGINVNVEDNYRRLPLHYYQPGSLAKDSSELLTCLRVEGASLDVYTDRGHAFAANMLELGYANEVKALLYLYNIDLNTSDSSGTSLLSYFVRNKNVDCGLIVLLQGMELDVNAVNNEGRSALWYAVNSINPRTVWFLLKQGAYPNNIMDAFGNENLRIDEPDKYFASNPKRIQCLELLLQFGANVTSMNFDQVYLFEIALRDNNVQLLYPVFEHVTMMAALGQDYDEIIFILILGDRRFGKYFNICCRKMRKIKETVIHKSATLFNFLVEPQEKLLKYARNPDNVKKLKCFVHRERHSKIRFIKNLRTRVKYIVEMAELRKQAAYSISQIVELGHNLYIIDKIVVFLDMQSLENVCQI